MTVGLAELLQQQQQIDTGTVITEGDGIAISPNTAGEETKIATSDGTAVITTNDDGEFQIGEGESVTSITNTINESDPNNNELLATVSAINARINSAVSGALQYKPVSGKSAFDTFLAQNVIAPSIVFVTDLAPFDYTDTNGLEITGMNWWLGIINKPSGQPLSTDTLFTSKSQDSLNGQQISSALYALSDHNQLTDSRASIVDTIQTTLSTSLGDKVDKVAGKGLSKNDLTDSYKSILENAPDNIVSELTDKLDITSAGTNVTIENVGDGNGYILFRNSSAPANQRDFRLIGRSDGTWDFEALADDRGLQNRWTYNHDGTSNFPNQITQSGNDVLDVTDSKYQNLPTNTTSELNSLVSSKVDKVAGKELSENDFTEDLKTLLETTAYSNLVSNSTWQLEGSVTRVDEVFTFSGSHQPNDGVISHTLTLIEGFHYDITFDYYTSGGIPSQSFRIELEGAGEAYQSNWLVTTRSEVQKGRFEYEAQSSGEFTLKFSDTSSETDGVDLKLARISVSRDKLHKEYETVSATESITVDGSEVLTESDRTTSITAGSGQLPDAPTVKAYVDANGGFNGGEITNNLIVDSNNKNSITLKAVDNSSVYGGMAWQNSGSFYTASLHREPTNASNDLLINVGSSSTLEGVPNALRIKEGSIKLDVNGGIHASGDIFAFDGGNMAANNISSVGKFIGSDYRLDGSENHDYHVLYTATQGNSSSPEGNKAADGKSFSGQATRIRVPNQTEQGFIVENGIGLNLFEVNGSTGVINTANQVFTGGSVFAPRNSRFGRAQSNHGSSNNGTMQYGSIVGSTFSGMQIDTADDGTYNEEVVSFWTHDGGNEAGKRMTIGKDGRTVINNKLLIGGNSYPSRTLDVIGDAKISMDMEVGGHLRVDGDIQIFDAQGHEHRLEHGTEGVEVRSLSNPGAGEAIFSVSSSGNSKRLIVEHDGAVKTSNSEIIVGTESDGSGGHPVMTPNNFGDLRAAYTYVQSFPSLSNSNIAQWFFQGADVEFIAVGEGTLNLPQIVDSNPSSSQVLVNSHIYITNSNSGFNINLSRFNSGQTFMVDHIGDLRTSVAVLWSSRIILKAIDARGITSISTDWAWSIRGV